MFAMLEDLVDHARGRAGGGGTKADIQHHIGAAIANLDQALERVVGVRAEVGARLSAIDPATEYARGRGHRSAVAALRPA